MIMYHKPAEYYCTCTNEQLCSITAPDIPEQVVLRGTLYEHVPSILLLAQFRKRTAKLKRDLNAPSDEIDRQAVRVLHMPLKYSAIEIYSQMSFDILK